jgi:hypothetical protein
MSEVRKNSKNIKHNNLEFLYDLMQEGVPLEDEVIQQLKDKGFIEKTIEESTAKEGNVDWRMHNDPTITNSGTSPVDLMVDVVEDENVFNDGDVISEEDYRKIVEEKGAVIYSGTKIDISQKDWLPKSVIEHEKDFIEWIDSLNSQGITKMKNYRKFNLYLQQAYQWIAENKHLSDFSDEEDRENYKDQEIDRCAQNTLYFLNKYLQLKESTIVVGLRQYKATKAHEVIIFMLDSGYSFYIGKPRQMAATSTLGGCALAKTLFKKNHYLKFVTQDKLKGEEIFEDKIKYPFAELPYWMRPNVINDRDNKFALGNKEEKGSREGVNSKMDVVAPSKTAVSGGTPSIAMIDEAGNIPILTQIIEDARPTMFGMDPATGKQKLLRQIIVWGTGGEMEKGGKAFERELLSAMKAWKERKFGGAIIPIFFDWTARPGMTQEMYDSEKEYYYSKEGPDADESKILFRQQYPTCLEDMFLSSSKTLVSQDWINEQIDRILKTNPMTKPKYGYFEPVYGDVEQPEGSDVPYNIIGANFVPLGIGDPRTTTIIFQEPKIGWKHRYYQGTDPIASDTGMSNMASSIWDAHYNTISAVVNWRDNNYREVFLQSMLLGVYYDTEKQFGVKELLEANIGKAYQQYKEYKGRFDSLVFNSELPDTLQAGSGNMVGIDNRNIRNKLIIDKMFEMLQAFGGKIYIHEMFVQLKTFVCTLTDKGNETWGPMDRKHYKDDILFAAVFSYICAQCHSHIQPINTIEQKKSGVKVVSSLEYDKNYNLKRVYKRVNVSR